MSDVIDWSKAPEGATQYVINCVGPWEKIEGGHLYYWYKGDWLKLPWRGDDSCSDIKIVKRPQPTPWSGEGLPPVGTVCGHVVSGDKDYPFIEWASGDKLEVIAHREVCGVMLPIVFNLRHNTATAIRPHLLKPIRTPEQIAADEREEFARTLTLEMGKDHGNSPSAMNQARKMYDLGYRKP